MHVICACLIVFRMLHLGHTKNQMWAKGMLTNHDCGVVIWMHVQSVMLQRCLCTS